MHRTPRLCAAPVLSASSEGESNGASRYTLGAIIRVDQRPRTLVNGLDIPHVSLTAHHASSPTVMVYVQCPWCSCCHMVAAVEFGETFESNLLNRHDDLLIASSNGEDRATESAYSICPTRQANARPNGKRHWPVVRCSSAFPDSGSARCMLVTTDRGASDPPGLLLHRLPHLANRAAAQ